MQTHAMLTNLKDVSETIFAKISQENDKISCEIIQDEDIIAEIVSYLERDNQ